MLFSLLISYEIRKEKVPTLLESKDDICKLDDLESSMECLIKEQGKWWDYNASNKDLYWNRLTGQLQDVDWDIIREEGGVCSHSSLWYVNRASELGYLSKLIKFYNNSTGHEIALVYEDDLSTYCLLDQSQLWCVPLKNGGIYDE
jgi:hypothetical protein